MRPRLVGHLPVLPLDPHIAGVPETARMLVVRRPCLRFASRSIQGRALTCGRSLSRE